MMTEQELRDIMGLCYPRDEDDREVLLFRVGLFPNSIDIYKNHLEQVELQLSREPRPLPTMKLNEKVTDLFAFDYSDFILEGYDPYPTIKGKVSV